MSRCTGSQKPVSTGFLFRCSDITAAFDGSGTFEASVLRMLNRSFVHFEIIEAAYDPKRRDLSIPATLSISDVELAIRKQATQGFTAPPTLPTQKTPSYH